jgi:putative membrane protein
MKIAAQLLITLIAFEHIYILVLEMFLWRTRARRIFGMTAEQAEATAVMAKNQGLYNGFLAAGLIWAHYSFHQGSPEMVPRATFFLACVVIAGVYGGITANRRILWIQGGPAALALIALYLS